MVSFKSILMIKNLFSNILHKVNLISKDELKSIGLRNYDIVNSTNSPKNLIN